MRNKLIIRLNIIRRQLQDTYQNLQYLAENHSLGRDLVYMPTKVGNVRKHRLTQVHIKDAFNTCHSTLLPFFLLQHPFLDTNPRLSPEIVFRQRFQPSRFGRNLRFFFLDLFRPLIFPLFKNFLQAGEDDVFHS